jgi:hypothetical protein
MTDGTQYAGLTPIERAAASADFHMRWCDRPTIADCAECGRRLDRIRAYLAAALPVHRAQVLGEIAAGQLAATPPSARPAGPGDVGGDVDAREGGSGLPAPQKAAEPLGWADAVAITRKAARDIEQRRTAKIERHSPQGGGDG